MDNLKSIAASFLIRLGISANFVTYLGLFLALLSGFLIYKGSFLIAAMLLLLSGVMDLLDGAIARSSIKANSFGGILDSSLDRYGDAFILGGVLFYCAMKHEYLYAGLSFSALIGSFSVSYIRGRAECVIKSCKVGFWERGERTVYLILGLLFNNLAVVLWVLGIGTHFTAIFRLYYAKKETASDAIKSPTTSISAWSLQNIFFQTRGRNNGAYLAKTIAWFLLVALVRKPI